MATARVFDPIALGFLLHPERAALVRAWPRVRRTRAKPLLWRRWADLAGVRDDAPRAHAAMLEAHGFIRRDGTIPGEVAKFLELQTSAAIVRGGGRR